MSTPTINSELPDHLRHADLRTLAESLNDQRTRAVDVVAPARQLRSVLGAIELSGVEPVVSEDGVTDISGCYSPTIVGEEGIALKLGIPIGYLRKCRAEAIDLYDSNVNTWLSMDSDAYLLRLLTHRDGPRPDSSAGVLRAFLSRRYRTIDNFDVLLAMLSGLEEAGVRDPVIDADLSPRRMVVRVAAPQISVLAPGLLANYRNPWTGREMVGGWTPERMAQHNAQLAARGRHGAADPVVFAGFVIANSETGHGRFSIVPRLVVQVCNNGMTVTADALSKVHIGGMLDEGVIEWSDQTIHRSLALVTSQTTDAVRSFLTPEYVQAKVEAIEERAATPVRDVPTVVAAVSKRLGFSEQQASSILAGFIAGGQLTCGGVMQAVTATAQTLPDADDAWDMELQGLAALDAAYAVARSAA